MSIQQQITIDHLLASSAIPFVFPATRLEIAGADGQAWCEWFGDGSMRQTAPIAPAVPSTMLCHFASANVRAKSRDSTWPRRELSSRNSSVTF